MIPKIAWIHWANPPMPWLRRKSVETFKKHHPDWQVWQVGTPYDIREKGLDYAKEADWTWWRLLREHGGFLIASDVVSVGRIPEAWHDADLCAQTTGNGDVYQFAALGCVPGNGLVEDAHALCGREWEEVKQQKGDTYQAFGVNLLRRVTQGDIYRFGKVYEMPRDAYCFYDWDRDPWDLWTEQGPSRPLPAHALGVHWYGGHEKSKEMEPTASPTGRSWIERFARDS
jgi:hypothetical protein